MDLIQRHLQFLSLGEREATLATLGCENECESTSNTNIENILPGNLTK